MMFIPILVLFGSLCVGALIAYLASAFILGEFTSIWEWHPGSRLIFLVASVVLGFLVMHVFLDFVQMEDK